MLEKQSQEVSGGSTAIQSTGSVVVHNHGFSALQVGEVAALVDLFLKSQLPAFEARAQKIAEENSAKLLNAFVAQAAAAKQPISGEEFSKPTGQAAFHTALAGVALHADHADIDLVAATLLRRLSSAEEPLLKLVLDGVLTTLPKLSAGHISYLSLVHYLTKVKLNAKTIEEFEGFAGLVIELFEAGSQLSSANIQYLAGLGLLAINSVSDADILYHIWNKNYEFQVDAAELARIGAKHIVRLHEMYVRLEIPKAHLTVNGSAIALLHLKRKFTGLNLADHIA